MGIRIKICGLTRPEDARAAAAAGATYGGVILAPNSPRTVHPERVSGIFADTPLLRCGVFVNESRERLVELAAALRLGVLQLHGDETPELVAAVRAGSGGEVWKVVRPRTGDEFARAIEVYAGVADGLMLDGWSAAARGGTGTRFPWHEVAAYRDRLPPGTRLIVAGGLGPENVAEVVEILSPDVVDVSSGVEAAPGIKDHDAIRRFADAARGARLNGDKMDGHPLHA